MVAAYSASDLPGLGGCKQTCRAEGEAALEM